MRVGSSGRVAFASAPAVLLIAGRRYACAVAEAPPLTLRSFPLDELAGGVLDLWLPDAPDELVRRAQRDVGGPASDLLAFWATLWPCAMTTAKLVGTTRLIDASMRILEIGSGVGLVGLCAAARGATVRLTDGDPAAVGLLERNIAQNGFGDRCDAAVYRWEDPPDGAWGPDLILGCDVLYDPASHGLVAELIATLGCSALLTDPQRPSAAGAAGVLRDHGLRVWETTAPAAGGGCAVRVLVVQA